MGKIELTFMIFGVLSHLKMIKNSKLVQISNEKVIVTVVIFLLKKSNM